MTPPQEPAAPPGSLALLGATRRLLRPLVALLIRKGITFPVITELLRGLYVDVAANDMLTDPKSRTDSRISLMTGVHRKEIRRQRSLEEREQPEPAIVTIATQVVARWLALGGNGPPPVLPRASDGDDPSFESIVAAVTTDIRPRALLEEWSGQGMVSLEEGDRVRLNVSAFLPDAGSDAQAFFLGRNLADHIAAGSANLLAATAPPFLDRSAHYDRLTPETAARIEAATRAIAERALQEMNQVAMAAIEAQDRALPPDAAAADRVNIGVFVYRADQPPPA